MEQINNNSTVNLAVIGNIFFIPRSVNIFKL